MQVTPGDQAEHERTPALASAARARPAVGGFAARAAAGLLASGRRRHPLAELWPA